VKKEIGAKTGSASVKRVGHTFSNRHGSEPNAKVRGGAVSPTDITFG